MRTREATYTDYGFKKGEEKQLKQYCLDLELPDKLLLLQCAHECNPMVEDDLFYSISKVSGISSLARKGNWIRITNAMQMFMDINEKHWHYSDLHYRHAEDIHFSNRMEN